MRLGYSMLVIVLMVLFYPPQTAAMIICMTFSCLKGFLYRWSHYKPISFPVAHKSTTYDPTDQYSDTDCPTTDESTANDPANQYSDTDSPTDQYASTNESRLVAWCSSAE